MICFSEALHLFQQYGFKSINEKYKFPKVFHQIVSYRYTYYLFEVPQNHF